jgi:MFS family permease
VSPSFRPLDSRPVDRRRLTRWLEGAHPAVLNGYVVALAFSTYFCMYAFRKPFAAAKYEAMYFLGTHVELKTALVIGQIVGYALSKFAGIKVCSEANRSGRAPTLIGLIVAAELALVLFAVLPPNWKVVAIFLNGLPLGMVWGLVVLYLEGRRTSELLLAGLSCSYIISSGVVKNIGLALMAGDGLLGVEALRLPAPISENWMPAVAGLIFLPAFFISVWLLNYTPEPTALDVVERTERLPMYRDERRSFLLQFAPGIVLLVGAYFFLTAFRDFRDNYQVDLLTELGYRYDDHKNAISVMELWVALGVMAGMAALFLIRDNRRALMGVFGIMVTGVLILGGATALWQAGAISGMWWVLLLGFGVYATYVPFGSVLFDRLIASTRVAGTAVFAIYVADALGYTGSVMVQLYKDLFAGQLARVDFLARFAYYMSAGGAIALAASGWYFLTWSRGPQAEAASLEAVSEPS